jgi:hypothetical protein
MVIEVEEEVGVKCVSAVLVTSWQFPKQQRLELQEHH